ncbi:MAG: hypothetical protein ACC726_06455 [Chloroflexota bacterium]
MDESDQIRETFARYGRSMYYAQVLEHGLVNTIVVVRIASMEPPFARSQDEWESIVDGLFDVHFEKTMGQLLKALDPLMDIPTRLEGLLREALSARNYLAHSFFRIPVREGMSVTGRDELIEELDAYSDLFIQTDRVLEEALRPLRERLGMTDEALVEGYREMYPDLDRE